MKSLHIFHHFTLHNGVDRTCLTLVKALHDLGHDPHAIVPQEGPVTEALADTGIPYNVMPLLCCTSPAWRAQLRFLSEAAVRATQVEDLLRQEDFDYVHINTGHPFDIALAAAKVGVPVIWHIHSPFETDYQRYERFLSPQGYAWILEGLGSQIITVSEDMRHDLIRHLPSYRVHTIFNGIDLHDLWQRAEKGSGNVRGELGFPGSSRIVLGVGRISKEKDFATFVRIAECIAAQDSKVYFVIAGPCEDQRLAESLKVQIVQSGLKERVFLLGSRSDVPRLMVQSDVFLSTSVSEGHPLTTLEAMAMDLPVVAMACTGLRECIQDRVDGLLVPLGDVEATADAVLQVIGNADLAEKLGRAARLSITERFSIHNYAHQFLDVADKALNFGPSLLAPGAVDLIQGLLGELGRARRQIDKLDIDRSMRARFRQSIRKVFNLVRLPIKN